MKLYDVAIIGGGPVGSRVAQGLSGMGHKVLVLERKDSPGKKVCCTGIVSQECVRSFAVDERLILRRVNSARLISPSGKVIKLQRQEIQACILDRQAFDVAMVHRAQEAGTEYAFSAPAKTLEVSSDRVTIETLRQGKEVKSDARVAVIACGFNSRLVERSGRGSINHFVMGAQAEVATPALAEMELYFGQKIAPGFFAWLVPTSPSRARVGLLCHRNPGPYLKNLINSLAAQGKIASTEAELSYGRVPLKPLARTRYDRLLIVGTAAGQVKPTTGGGIYYGLLCADMAANTLHQALDSDALSARGLANYERQWQKRLGQELKKGYRVRRFYERLGDQEIDRLFDVIEARDIATTLLRDGNVSFDWHSGSLLRILAGVAISQAAKTARSPLHSREGIKNPKL